MGSALLYKQEDVPPERDPTLRSFIRKLGGSRSQYVVGGSLLVQEMSWVRVIVISMPLISAKETLYSSDELSQFS